MQIDAPQTVEVEVVAGDAAWIVTIAVSVRPKEAPPVEDPPAGAGRFDLARFDRDRFG